MKLQINLLLFSSFDAGYTRLYGLPFNDVKDSCQGIQGIPLIAKSMSVTGFHSVNNPDIKLITDLL